MSDQIPMPKVIEATPPSSARDYAPKRGLEAVAEAVMQSTLGQGGGTGYKPPLPYPSQVNAQHTATIKDAIKKLTHREMREMVEAIFAAHKAIDNVKEIGPNDNIPMGRLADVLDAFAYGQ